jgi:hypothetical protein
VESVVIKNLILIVFCAGILTGCENEEQKARISELESQVAAYESQVAAYESELNSQNLKETIKKYLDRLDSPVNQFSTGISYRDFSGVRSQILNVVQQFKREDVATGHPEIVSILDDLVADLTDIQEIWEVKVSDTGMNSILIDPESVPEGWVEKLNLMPSTVDEANGRYWREDVLLNSFNLVTAAREKLWEQYSRI